MLTRCDAMRRDAGALIVFRGCETYVIREGWEGLVRGNESESNPVSPPSSVQSSPTLRPTDTIHSLASSAKGTEGSVTKEVFKGVTGEGELLKQGEGEVALKGKHIIRCRWDDVRGFLSEVRVPTTFLLPPRFAAICRTYGGLSTRLFASGWYLDRDRTIQSLSRTTWT